MIKTIKCLVIFSLILNAFVSTCLAWKTNKGDPAGTHESLSRYAAVYFSSLKTCIESTDLNCGKLSEFGFNEELDEPMLWGKNKPAWEWLIYGADKEDSGRLVNMATNTARFNNHFHNALKIWENAGLDEWILIPPFHVHGKSSLLWAQDSEYQSGLDWLGDDIWPDGDWSWKKTREYFYLALTPKNEEDTFLKTKLFQCMYETMRIRYRGK
jgi:hypothetical protein